MALTRTLGQIVDAIQRTADVVAFTDKHPVAYIQDLACRGLAALNRITATTNPEFRPVGTTTIVTDGRANSYGLPVDFRSLIAVEYTVDRVKSFLEPYEWPERPALENNLLVNVGGRAHGFKLIGSNLDLQPLPAAGHSVQLWYATTALQPSDPATAVDVYDRLDDYVIWYAAREIAGERENWPRYDRLTTSMGALEGDIRILARSRDLSTPTRITDRRDMRRLDVRRRGWLR